MKLVARIRAWLSAARRQAIYSVVAAVVPVLVLAGTITNDQTQYVLTGTSLVLQVLAGVLQLSNLSPAQASDWFVTSGRAAVYAIATAAAPVAVGLGWLNDVQTAHVLQIVSVALTVVAAILGVVHARDDGSKPAT